MKNAENPLIQISCRIKFLYTKYPNSVLRCDNLVLHDKYAALYVSYFLQNQTEYYIFWNVACLFFCDA